MQAYIASVIKSYADWANKEAILVFFAGCDFRCNYCFVAPILDFKEEFLKDIKEIKEIIKNLSYSSNAIYFTGGEPCLQRAALIELAKFSKKLGLKTGLQTNGSNPKVIRNLLDLKNLDYISIDIKAPFDADVFEKATKSKTFFKAPEEIISGIEETIKLVKNAENIEVDIRTTIVPSIMFKKEHILRIASEIKSINCRWILQQYQPMLGKLVNTKLAGINPPSQSFLENIKEACLKIYPTLNIEIKTGNFNVA